MYKVVSHSEPISMGDDEMITLVVSMKTWFSSSLYTITKHTSLGWFDSEGVALSSEFVSLGEEYLAHLQESKIEESRRLVLLRANVREAT